MIQLKLYLKNGLIWTRKQKCKILKTIVKYTDTPKKACAWFEGNFIYFNKKVAYFVSNFAKI